jgi:hypothetical protein
MQYEIVFKSDRMFMLYLPSSKFSTAAQRALKKVAPGTLPMAQRLLIIATPEHGPHMHVHTKNGKR